MYHDLARSQQRSSLEWVVLNLVIPSFLLTFLMNPIEVGARLHEEISYEVLPVVTPPEPVVPPVLVSIHRPDYPMAMRRAGTEGRVVLKGIVDARGRVRRSSIEILQTTDAHFDAAARRAFGGAVFWPAGGRLAVEAWVTMAIEFNLYTE